MQSIIIHTVSLETGITQDFSYACRSEDFAMSIIKGTLAGCSPQGWAMTGFEIL